MPRRQPRRRSPWRRDVIPWRHGPWSRPREPQRRGPWRRARGTFFEIFPKEAHL
jgi:hypothetical protein